MLSNAFDREKDTFQAGGDLDRAKYQFQTVKYGPGGSQWPGQGPNFWLVAPLAYVLAPLRAVCQGLIRAYLSI